MHFLSVAFLAATLAMLSPPSAAERADREREIVGGADRARADDASKTSTFEGNVVITQGSMRITAAKVTVREDAQGFKLYVANGTPVTFRQKRDKVDEWVEGFAERAEFDDRSEVLKLFTRARVKSEANEITGEFISYDMRNAVTSVQGATPGKLPAEGSRVKMVILPAKKPREGAAAAPERTSPGMTLKPDTGTP